MCCRSRVTFAGAVAGDPGERNISCTPDTRMASLSYAIARVASGVRASRRSAHTFHTREVSACQSWVAETVHWRRRHSAMRLSRSMQVALRKISCPHNPTSLPELQTYLMNYPCSSTPECLNPETQLPDQPCSSSQVACSVVLLLLFPAIVRSLKAACPAVWYAPSRGGPRQH